MFVYIVSLILARTVGSDDDDTSSADLSWIAQTQQRLDLSLGEYAANQQSTRD